MAGKTAEENTSISIECVDNCDGFPCEVVYGNISYPIPCQHVSSVRPFQLARYENEDPATLDIDPPENDTNSSASLQEEDEEEEEQEEEEEEEEEDE